MQPGSYDLPRGGSSRRGDTPSWHTRCALGSGHCIAPGARRNRNARASTKPRAIQPLRRHRHDRPSRQVPHQLLLTVPPKSAAIEASRRDRPRRRVDPFDGDIPTRETKVAVWPSSRIAVLGHASARRDGTESRRRPAPSQRVSLTLLTVFEVGAYDERSRRRWRGNGSCARRERGGRPGGSDPPGARSSG